ncbi:uncharacterized protein LOC124912573 [Impatiens glandulifera]|uniref:uncharacterized protein LOC124912573 n=1 Tax=Impatiens glandulifera TaxID=253017 RepID=UPI001FB0DE3A|nr:uncharacterized protein LOC124912573 [Impatiens glandulifera]
MANGIPMRFKRMSTVSESSGSEHSPEGSMNLSDLVNSFIEREAENNEDDIELSESETEIHSYSAMKMELRSLLGNNHQFKEEIQAEICDLIGSSSSERKRILMNRLRNRGFDAGLCKSKWERTGKHPSGSYDYIDIKTSDNRYIVEIDIGNEFSIARQSKPYSSLLDLFPSILVIKADDLKKIVKLMSKAMKNSLYSVEMSIPPWRTNGYMKAKWFSAFKRTINESPLQKGSYLVPATKRRSDGFEPVPLIVFKDCNCRKNLGGGRVGQLALALNSPAIYL